VSKVGFYFYLRALLSPPLARTCWIWLEIVSHVGHLELFAKEFGGKLGNVSLSLKASGQLGNVSR
jgi:hypothetical protein